jgi:hypothetical protein
VCVGGGAGGVLGGARVGLGAALGCAVGWAAGLALTCLITRAFLWWIAAGWGGAAADGFALCGGGAGLLAAAGAGAVRANKVAKPTAVRAPSWVARQVRRDRRRSPAARAAPGSCPGPAGES